VNTPHPDLETLAELADRDPAPASEMAPRTEAATPQTADPQTADPQTAELLAHVAGCAACTADLEALRRVRDTLRALPPVPMPADVAERIEAALLAARASSTPLAASAGGDTVVPLRQRSKPAGRSGPASSRWRTLPYGAAASIVVLVAVVVVGIVALGHSGSNDKKTASSPGLSAAAAATSPGSTTIASGTSYTSADLRSQVASVVTSNIPGAASNFPGLTFGLSEAAAGSAAVPAAAASAPAAASSAPAAAAPVAPAASSAAAAPASSAPGPLVAAPTSAAASGGGALNGGTADHAITAPAGPLADPAALARCVQILAGKAEQPLLVDYALFNGAPSTIIVLPDPDVAHKLDIYVEADTANCANQEFTFETFLGPTPGP
jgi:hypothetical protein